MTPKKEEQETDPRIRVILVSGIKILPMPQALLSLNRLLNDADAGPTLRHPQSVAASLQSAHRTGADWEDQIRQEAFPGP